MQVEDALDRGTGGTALAVYDPPGPGSDVEFYVGSRSFFAAPYGAGMQPQPSDDAVSLLACVRYTGNTNFGAATLTIVSTLLLDGLGGRPKVYGVCGIAVGDIVQDAGHPGDEIVVGSLDGHVLVFARAAGVGFGALLQEIRVEGAVGVHNSFAIVDLDGDSKNELYAAGSLGLRKWLNP